MKNPFPKQIKKIAIVGLASKPDSSKIRKTRNALDKFGIETSVTKSLTKKGWDRVLPCSAELRAQELQECWLDKTVDLVISGRGGYGSAQLCDLLNWQKVAKRSLPVLGYSDITAFHLAMLKYNAGIPICSPVATQIHEVCKCDIASESLYQALDHALNPPKIPIPFLKKLPPQFHEKIRVLQPGKAKGKIIPANLTVLASLIGTAHMPDLRKCILMFEDINEPLYKLDRYLTQIQQAGLFAKFAGLIFADFHRCGDVSGKNKIFAKFAEQVSGPVVCGVPFGHITPPLSFEVGQKILLQA